MLVWRHYSYFADRALAIVREGEATEDVEALIARIRDAFGLGRGHGHWDPTGTSGANCWFCDQQRLGRDRLEAALDALRARLASRGATESAPFKMPVEPYDAGEEAMWAIFDDHGNGNCIASALTREEADWLAHAINAYGRATEEGQ